MKQITKGSEFLNLVFKDMKDTIRSDSKDPSKRIEEYLERLERLHGEALTDEHKRDLLKSFYYDKYIIKTLPESYIKYRKGFFHDLGLAEKQELTEEDKALVLGCIKHEQKKSLDNWLNFLSQDETYPTWFKYYVFQGVTKVGVYYKILGDFTKRSASTTAPFISVDKPVIDDMYQLVSKYVSGEPLTSDEQEITKYGLNFRNVYSQVYRKINKKSNIIYSELDDVEEHIGPAVPDYDSVEDIVDEDDGFLLPPPEEESPVVKPKK